MELGVVLRRTSSPASAKKPCSCATKVGRLGAPGNAMTLMGAFVMNYLCSASVRGGYDFLQFVGDGFRAFHRCEMGRTGQQAQGGAGNRVVHGFRHRKRC